jgi:hypothetical protein
MLAKVASGYHLVPRGSDEQKFAPADVVGYLARIEFSSVRCHDNIVVGRLIKEAVIGALIADKAFDAN